MSASPSHHPPGAAPCVVWRFTDGRPGHDSQSLGLVQALRERVPLNVFNIGVAPIRRSGLHWLARRFPPGRRLPAPRLLIGAGHGTHWPMLAARRACGGRIVLLMKPSLPLRWFDVCLVPDHDRPRPAANVLVTAGAVNRIRPGGTHDPAQGLVLLGGPSREYGWAPQALTEQLAQLFQARPCERWTVVLSRRTPAGFAERLASSAVRVVPFAAGGDDWLPLQLAQAGEVWVTEDSASMLYEALTSGAQVGVLAMPRRRRGRVARGVESLVAQGRIAAPGRFDTVAASTETFDEAARCAAWIVQQWLSD